MIKEKEEKNKDIFIIISFIIEIAVISAISIICINLRINVIQEYDIWRVQKEITLFRNHIYF